MGHFYCGKWLLPLLLFSMGATAQVYTWTDENGKVHYSDQRRVEDAEAQRIDIGAMPAPPAVDHYPPDHFSDGQRPLVLESFYYTDEVSRDNNSLITYYFGGDCVSPTSHNFNQLRTRYPGVLREDKQLQADMFRALRTRAYANLYRAGHYDLPKEDAELRYLTGRIEKLVINACRSRLPPSANTSDLENTEVTQFNLVNAWIQVRWMLSPELAGDAEWELVTQGVAATQLNPDLRLRSTVREAFARASDNLLANDEFRQRVHSVSGATSSGTPMQADTPNLLDVEMEQYRRAQFRTAFAQALVELNQVKIAISEYYQIRGVMPLSMDAIGFRSGAQSRSRYLESMQMQAPGVVHAVLPEESLPGGHYIELVPEIERGFTRIEWRCLTSVPDYIRASACKEP